MKRRCPFKLNCGEKGFTLVELIVVLVVIGILAAILIPSFKGYIEDAHAKQCFTNRQKLDDIAYSIVDVYYWTDLTKENVLSGEISDPKVKAKTEELVNPHDFACPAGGRIYYEMGVLKCSKHDDNALSFANAVYNSLDYMMNFSKVKEYFKSRDKQYLDSTGLNYGIPTKEYMMQYLNNEFGLEGDYDFMIYRDKSKTPPYQIYLFDPVTGKSVGDEVDVIKVYWDYNTGAYKTERGSSFLMEKTMENKKYLAIDPDQFKVNDI